MKVLLVTSDRERCGVRETGRMLTDALAKVAPEIDVVEWPNTDPQSILNSAAVENVVLLLNFHAALHSRWREAEVAAAQLLGYKVVVIQHDTFETFAIMQERGFPDFRGADALVVHEPVDGLTHTEGKTAPEAGALYVSHAFSPAAHHCGIHYIRQGVLGDQRDGLPEEKLLGSFGFPLQQKNYESICRMAYTAGWNVLLLAAGATKVQEAAWKTLNPGVRVVSAYLSSEEVVKQLSCCSATGFLYSGGGSGTSGAIRFGLAARRPLLAFRNRQFRDLFSDQISWLDSEEVGVSLLNSLDLGEVSWLGEEVAKIAERDSWTRVARAYASILKGLSPSGTTQVARS